MSIDFYWSDVRYFQRPARLIKNHISHNLGGVVGQNLIPHDYHIDEIGNIMLKGNFCLIDQFLPYVIPHIIPYTGFLQETF